MNEQEKHELNLRVHTEIFGNDKFAVMQDYANRISATWLIFEHFEKLGFGHSHTRYAMDGSGSVEHIPDANDFFVSMWMDYHNVTVHRPDLCEAICVCGLAVVAYLKNLEIEKKANEIINAALDEHIKDQITAENSLPKQKEFIDAAKLEDNFME